MTIEKNNLKELIDNLIDYFYNMETRLKELEKENLTLREALAQK